MYANKETLMKRYHPGDQLAPRELQSIDGRAVHIPDGMTHLQFRRFAGCPICDLHLRSIVRRHEELRARGIREVVVFHSSAEELRAFEAHELPFAVIADPGKRLYREFGVTSGVRALADPRAWWPLVRAVATALWRTLRGEAPFRIPSVAGGNLGLPADFLIASDGRILASKYGQHAYDQWSVDQLLFAVEALAQPTGLDRHARVDNGRPVWGGIEDC